jgi:hypothetical protein
MNHKKRSQLFSNLYFEKFEGNFDIRYICSIKKPGLNSNAPGFFVGGNLLL